MQMVERKTMDEMYTWVPFSFSHGQEMYTLQTNKIKSPSPGEQWTLAAILA